MERVNLAANRFIKFSYDGTGQCISREMGINTIVLRSDIYIDEFVVNSTSSTLTYINIPEGRVRTASGAGTYEYYIKDHLGNVRVSFENHLVRQ